MDWSQLLDWSAYSKLLVALIVITDPIGALPVVVALTETLPIAEKMRTVGVASLTFLATLLFFTYVGSFLLDLLGITIAGFQVAGGVLFLFYALEMMGLVRLPGSSGEPHVTTAAAVGIVPIGIPMLAGPGTISTVIIASSVQASLPNKLLVSGVILTVGLIVYAGFRVWLTIGGRLGATVLLVIKRIMGLLLAAIAIEFIVDGVTWYLTSMTGAP